MNTQAAVSGSGAVCTQMLVAASFVEHDHLLHVLRACCPPDANRLQQLAACTASGR